jgi:hypothetical protein
MLARREEREKREKAFLIVWMSVTDDYLIINSETSRPGHCASLTTVYIQSSIINCINETLINFGSTTAAFEENALHQLTTDPLEDNTSAFTTTRCPS